MALSGAFNYKSEAKRYDYYYRRLQRFYEQPITQVSAAVLFTLGTIIFFAVFAIKPTLETISTLLKTIETKEVLLEKAEQKAAALGTAQQQLDQFEPYADALESAIPNRTDIQTLITSIEALASQDGIPVQSLRVSEITYPETGKKGAIEEVGFMLSVNAAYPQDKLFLEHLAKLNRLVTIESVSFQPDTTTNQSDDNTSIQMSVACKAYVSPEAAL